MKKLLIMFAVAALFSGCKKCYTCTTTVTVDTYYTFPPNTAHIFISNPTVTTVSENVCDFSKNDLEAKEKGTSAIASQAVTTSKMINVKTTTSCNCQ